MNVDFNGKKIELEVKGTGFFSRGLGLMFKTRRTSNLLFDFKKDSELSLTSYFVFFPFLTLWLDSKNQVVDRKIVKPFQLRIRCNKKFRKVIEVPLNENNKEILEFFRR